MQNLLNTSPEYRETVSLYRGMYPLKSHNLLRLSLQRDNETPSPFRETVPFTEAIKTPPQYLETLPLYGDNKKHLQSRDTFPIIETIKNLLNLLRQRPLNHLLNLVRLSPLQRHQNMHLLNLVRLSLSPRQKKLTTPPQSREAVPFKETMKLNILSCGLSLYDK